MITIFSIFSNIPFYDHHVTPLYSSMEPYCNRLCLYCLFDFAMFFIKTRKTGLIFATVESRCKFGDASEQVQVHPYFQFQLANLSPYSTYPLILHESHKTSINPHIKLSDLCPNSIRNHIGQHLIHLSQEKEQNLLFFLCFRFLLSVSIINT